MRRFSCLFAVLSLQLLVACALVVYIAGAGRLFPNTSHDSIVVTGMLLALAGMGFNALLALVRCLLLPHTARGLWVVILVIEALMMAGGLLASAIGDHHLIWFCSISLGAGCLLSACVAGMVASPQGSRV